MGLHSLPSCPASKTLDTKGESGDEGGDTEALQVRPPRFLQQAYNQELYLFRRNWTLSKRNWRKRGQRRTTSVSSESRLQFSSTQARTSSISRLISKCPASTPRPAPLGPASESEEPIDMQGMTTLYLDGMSFTLCFSSAHE